MKSIKEKAKEYAKIKHTDQNLIEIVSWDFEAGANYVLECFESVLPFVVKKGIIYGKIKETIDQLKGELPK